MRVAPYKIDHVKQSSTKLKKYTGCKLSSCQNALSKALGYRDFHDLQNSHRSTNEQFGETINAQERLQHILKRCAAEIETDPNDIARALVETRIITGQPLPLISQATTYANFMFSLQQHNHWQSADIYLDGIKRKSHFHEEALISQPVMPDKPVRYISHRSSNSGAAGFEVFPHKKPAPFLPRRLFIPYGWWETRFSEIVFFSRDYLPLWIVEKNGTIRDVCPSQWIKGESAVHHFRTDGLMPTDPTEIAATIEHINDYGITSLPNLAFSFPKLMQNPEKCIRVIHRPFQERQDNTE